MKYALSLALVLALSLVAQAGVTAPQTINGITVTVTQDTVTPPTISGLTAYIISLSSANNIASVDGRIDAATGGYLYQTWYVNALPTPDGENLTATNLKNDTHILVPVPSQVAVRSPDEDLVNFDYVNGVADPNHLHDGTTLCGTNGNVVGDGTNDFTKTMAFGIIASTNLPAGNLSNFPFARVVLNTASNSLGAMFDFKVVDSQSNLATFDFNIISVPEPMTLSLLGAGALALIRRRR